MLSDVEPVEAKQLMANPTWTNPDRDRSLAGIAGTSPLPGGPGCLTAHHLLDTAAGDVDALAVELGPISSTS
jgi:hypothetical protein